MATHIVTARVAIMAVLLDGESYGYEILETCKARTDGKIAPGQGVLYPELRSLERAGMVKVRLDDSKLPERGGRPRYYYKLTPKGRKHAEEMRTALLTLFGLDMPNAEGKGAA